MDIAEVLRQNGYKVTPQRLAVYAVIEHNPTHPNAEVIYRELQPQYPSMSLATVYKTMEIFAIICVVKVLQCGDNTMPHAHIRCTSCNQIADVDIDQDGMAKAAAEQTGYVVDSVGVAFTGLCPQCRNKKV